MKRWLATALVAGALLRLPGVAWGFNWPDGFAGHHPDEWTHLVNAEFVMNPQQSPRFDHPYPMALGAIVGAPVLLASVPQGHFGGTRPAVQWTMLAGRLVVVLFGVGAIFLVYLIGRDVLRSERVGVVAAGLLAVGGMHVTQSHFFVSDVPATTWLLLSLWLLWRDATSRADAGDEWLRWGAFFTGATFAMKLFVFSFPVLGLVALGKAPRWRRVVHATIFAVAGFLLSNLGFDPPTRLFRILAGGTNDPYVFDRGKAALLYLVQLPGIFSLPLLALSLAGAAVILRRAWMDRAEPRARWGLLIFGLVPAINLMFIIFMLDHFPRHWVPLVPWAALAGALALVRLEGWLRIPRTLAPFVGVPVFLWMLALVVDGERGFLNDPRNSALGWLREAAPAGSTVYWSRHRAPTGYKDVRWQDEGNPDYLVIEMYDANNYLSGVDWRDSYPADPRGVFDVESPERLAAFQALFRGQLPYREVARFREGYVMPEHRLALRLVGDRARSYVTEVVVFRKDRHAGPPSREGGDS